jgi:tetratricopeptide (TPR) repeat protein
MHAQEFVRRFKILLEDPDSRFVFFLGAGCSGSSGIPDAGALVRQWLPRLKVLRTGNDDNLQEWIDEEFPGYRADNASLFYGRVIEDLFLTREERQKEIERLTEGKDPGFGYAVLSQIVSNKTVGRHCNIILTTNFDDMVADALYLYTNKKPLVIAHETLVGFVRISRTRPLVIKLHGDARLSPKNTEIETQELDESVKKVLKNLLSEVGVVFIGYGGNDKSIVSILKDLHKDALPGGVWWINDKMPDNEMAQWLNERNVKWVNHLDFDELMLLLLNELGLKHPEGKRFDRLIKTYFDTFEKLKNKIEAKPDNEESKPLKEAFHLVSDKIVEEGEYSWAIVDEARKYEETDPGKADTIYLKGVERFHNDSWLLTCYAEFLKNILNDPDKAEEFYKKAVDAESDYGFALNRYAEFLNDIRKDPDKAEEFYKKAVDAEPDYVYALGRYAEFLNDIRKDPDKAEEFYKKAVDAEPVDIFALTNYAGFLNDIRNAPDKAEEFYNRAIDAEPDNVYALTHYAGFLDDIRKDPDKVAELYNKIEKLNKSNHD